MTKKLSFYNGSTQLSLAGLSIALTSSPGIGKLSAGGFAITNDFLELTGSYGFGVYISTRKAKRFLSTKNTPSDTLAGRFFVKTFDINGNQIGDGSSVKCFGNPEISAMTYQTSNAVYLQSSNTKAPAYFVVTSDVDYVFLGFLRYSATAQIKSFQVYNLDTAEACEVLNKNDIPDGKFATTIPTGITIPYKVGDKIINDNPVAGSYIGWVCITAGSPGTWKGYGLIQV